jgi:murein DD-endopeptidase MepM/ murein hydrolase activator NlpD
MLKTKKYTKNRFLFSAIIMLGVVFFIFQKQSSAYSECDAFTGTAKKQCESKMDKAETYQKIINLKQKQEAVINGQLQQIDAEQGKTQQSLKTTSEKLAETLKQIGDLEEKIKENEKQIGFQRKMLRALMQNYYEYDQQGILSIVLLEKNLSDSLRGADYIQQSGMKVNELLAEIKKTKKELEDQKIQLENAKNESEKLKATLEDKNLTLQNTEDQKQVLLGQTQKEKEKYSQLLASIEDEISSLESGISGQVNYSNLPPDKNGYFAYPVKPVVISQGYGKTSYSKHYTSGLHNGIDFSIKYAPVYAVKAGKVIATGNNGRYAYGKWIAIDHSDGLVTLYGHFSSIGVSKGQKVGEREKIGTSGNTGFSTGPHLHFSVFVKSSFEVVESKKVSGLMLPVGASINPKKYF